jgi:hypothetical protein
MKTGPKPLPVGERFWSKVNKNGPIPAHRPKLGRCWVWTGSLNDSGRGQVRFDGGITKLAHRVAWFLTHGSFPKHQACHKCDNPPCVRPSHLFDGTQKENLDDMVTKGRSVNQNTGKTHCPQSHPYDHVDPATGWKSCRRCKLASYHRCKENK